MVGAMELEVVEEESGETPRRGRKTDPAVETTLAGTEESLEEEAGRTDPEAGGGRAPLGWAGLEDQEGSDLELEVQEEGVG